MKKSGCCGFFGKPNEEDKSIIYSKDYYTKENEKKPLTKVDSDSENEEEASKTCCCTIS